MRTYPTFPSGLISNWTSESYDRAQTYPVNQTDFDGWEGAEGRLSSRQRIQTEVMKCDYVSSMFLLYFY